MLRYVDDSHATVWVETDRPCSVTVEATPDSGAPVHTTTRTWSLHGHHFALVVVSGLQAGVTAPYTVRLDGRPVWPDPTLGLPPSVIRTFSTTEDFRLAFGSCRRSAGDSPAELRRFGADALVALARRMRTQPHEAWPDALFCAGDQIYADHPSPALRKRLLAQHGVTSKRQLPATHPRREVADEVQTFDEYSWLYHDAWGGRDVRWLLSTVPSVMLLDDHDLRDDWNTSQAWHDTVSATPWWRQRVQGAYVSYWAYQHLGNLSPAQLEEDEWYGLVRSIADEDERGRVLDELAWLTDIDPERAKWSFVRDFGNAETTIRLVALDVRCSRVLEPSRRAIMDDREFAWFLEQISTPVDHLLIGATLPYLMVPGVHHLEGWNEALAAGRYGRLVARVSEAVRQAVDLEHWAAFRRTFIAFARALDEVVAGETPPASLLLLSGDVHCSYLATGSLPRLDPRRTGFHQLTMSPFRNPLEQPVRWANRLLSRRGVHGLLRRLADRAEVAPVPVTWTISRGLWFHNGVMTVVLDGRDARVEVDHARAQGQRQLLRRTATVDLTPTSVEESQHALRTSS